MNQLPFTSINTGTCTLVEGRMVTKALLEECIKGLGKNGVTSIFPCVIFQYKKGINDKPGTPNYDLKRLALESTSKRIYPNYANCDWSAQKKTIEADRTSKQQYLDNLDEKDYNKLIYILENNPEVEETLGIYSQDDRIFVDPNERPIEMFSTMGCRTANGLDINAIDNFKQNIQATLEERFDDIDDVFSGAQKDGRGNICPVTVILPTLALIAKQKVDNSDLTNEEYKEAVFNEFIKLLDKKIGEAKDMLIERFNHICSQSYKSARYMYENKTMTGYHKEEGIISALKHGTLAIGQLGLAEALQIMFYTDHTTEEGMKYAKIIESLFAKNCAGFKEKYKLNFGVYYTPAENLCKTAIKNFKRLNPDFDQEYVTYLKDAEGNRIDKKYFTNSIHVPVWETLDVFKKIDIESELVNYSSAGCITYVELDSTCFNNIDAIEKIVDYAMEKDVPYFALNIPLNRCSKCNEPIYDESLDHCPKCGNDKIIKLGRITG